MNIINLTEHNFNAEVMQSDKPVLVDFYTDWCGPCKFIAPVIENLAGEYEGRAKICKLNIDNARDLAFQFNIMGVPTIIIFNNKKEVDRIIGAVSKQKIIELLNKSMAYK